MDNFLLPIWHTGKRCAVTNPQLQSLLFLLLPHLGLFGSESQRSWKGWEEEEEEGLCGAKIPHWDTWDLRGSTLETQHL